MPPRPVTLPALDTERPSKRRLDDVGATAVLGAMIAQRKRASQLAADELEPADSLGENTTVETKPPVKVR